MPKFINYLLKNRVGISTAKKYNRFIQQILGEYGDIDASFQDRFVLDKLDKWSKNSIATYLKAIRHYADFTGVELDECSFKNLRQPSVIPTFSEDEIYQLTEHLLDSWHRYKDDEGRWSPQRAKWSIFWLMVMWTGCRCGEIAKLKSNQVNTSANTLIIHATKTNNIRNVPVLGIVQSAFYEYVDRASMVLFPNVYTRAWSRSFKGMLKKVGIHRKGLVPHSFRHTFITMLLDEDVSMPKVMALVGHKRIETTYRYTHLLSKSVRLAINNHPVVKQFNDAETKIELLITELMRQVSNDPRIQCDIAHEPNQVVLRLRGSPKRDAPPLDRKI